MTITIQLECNKVRSYGYKQHIETRIKITQHLTTRNRAYLSEQSLDIIRDNGLPVNLSSNKLQKPANILSNISTETSLNKKSEVFGNIPIINNGFNNQQDTAAEIYNCVFS
eukprot:410553_1